MNRLSLLELTDHCYGPCGGQNTAGVSDPKQEYLFMIHLSETRRDLCIYLFLDFRVGIIIVHHVQSVYNDYASDLAFLGKTHPEFNKGS